MNPPNYAYQFQSVLDGQDKDRKVPESHPTSCHDNTANGKANNLQSTGQSWIV